MAERTSLSVAVATAEAALSAGPLVRVVRQPNAGIGVTRSRAVAATRGELVVLLDADDLLTPDSIECRVRALSANPELDLVFGQVRHFTAYANESPIPLDWMLCAREHGLREVTVPDQVLWRRVHGANNSIINRALLGEFPRALKASLDRRRAHGN